MKAPKGFTLIELMVTIAIVAIVAAIALPNINEFLVRMKVDNEISSLNRLLLTARSSAINNASNVTICPLANTSSTSSCTNNWQGNIAVFIDANNNGNMNRTLTSS